MFSTRLLTISIYSYYRTVYVHYKLKSKQPNNIFQNEIQQHYIFVYPYMYIHIYNIYLYVNRIFIPLYTYIVSSHCGTFHIVIVFITLKWSCLFVTVRKTFCIVNIFICVHRVYIYIYHRQYTAYNICIYVEEKTLIEFWNS